MIVGNKIRAISSLNDFIFEPYLIFFQKGSMDCFIWGVDKSANLKQIKNILTGSLTHSQLIHYAFH